VTEMRHLKTLDTADVQFVATYR